MLAQIFESVFLNIFQTNEFSIPKKCFLAKERSHKQYKLSPLWFTSRGSKIWRARPTVTQFCSFYGMKKTERGLGKSRISSALTTISAGYRQSAFESVRLTGESCLAKDNHRVDPRM